MLRVLYAIYFSSPSDAPPYGSFIQSLIVRTVNCACVHKLLHKCEYINIYMYNYVHNYSSS